MNAVSENRLSSFENMVGDAEAVDALRSASPTFAAAASEFWRVPLEGGHLSPRMCELVLLAMHASATAMNVTAARRHIERAKVAGATDEDIVDVLFTITAVANHALYFSVPILEEELAAAGAGDATDVPPSPEHEAMKLDFIQTRGFWNADRERFARLMPDYFRALNAMSTDSWKNGALSPKDEFVCMAVDCTVTHTYEPGLRLHIRNAIARGATRDEILQIFQLAALIGLEGYVLGAQALVASPSIDGD